MNKASEMDFKSIAITDHGVMFGAINFYRAARAKDKCATVCDGMNCPAGWQTGRSPEDHCKCICVRTDPSKATAWDRAHNQARFFPEDETAGATHVKSHEPDS